MAEIMYNNLYGAYREALCTIELCCMHHTAESYAPYSKLSNLTVLYLNLIDTFILHKRDQWTLSFYPCRIDRHNKRSHTDFIDKHMFWLFWLVICKSIGRAARWQLHSRPPKLPLPITILFLHRLHISRFSRQWPV